MAKMTSKELIAKKTDILKRQKGSMRVNIGELGEWEFKVPNADELIDAQEYERTHGKTADTTGDVYLVYSMCVSPDLHDKELQEAFGVRGAAVVNVLLRPGEVRELAGALMDAAGYGDSSIEYIGAEEVKN